MWGVSEGILKGDVARGNIEGKCQWGNPRGNVVWV